MTTPEQQDTARRAVFTRRLSQEIRELREASGLSQAAVGEWLGWQRAAVSKIERGDRDIGIFEYLTLMQFLREVEPGHPAVALAARLLPPLAPASSRRRA